MGNRQNAKAKQQETANESNSEPNGYPEHTVCIDVGSVIDDSKYILKAIKTSNENVAILMKEWSSNKNNIFCYFNCIEQKDDSIAISTNFTPSILYLEHKFEKIKIDITEDIKYLIIYVDFGRLIKFVPIETLKEYLKISNNSIDITNNGIDITGSEFIHSLPECHGKLCTKYLRNDRFVIGYSPQQNLNENEWPINFYIYSCETGKLINQIVDKIKIPNYNKEKEKETGYVDITSLKDLEINENRISFCNARQTHKFEYDKLGKMKIFQQMGDLGHSDKKSPSGKYECWSRDCSIYMRSMEGESHIIGEWRFADNLKNKRFVAEYWYNDHVFVGYTDKKIYVLTSAVMNDAKREILQQFQFGNMTNIILEMIGFELYGVWLSNFDGLYAKKAMQREYALSAYFGANKQYAIITKTKMPIKHIIVDLDRKYCIAETFEFILD